MKIKIAIPAYNNPEGLKTKTLAFLKRAGGSELFDVTLYLQGQDQYRLYREANALEGVKYHIHEGVGEHAQKNEMLKTIKTPFYMMDDDIEDFWIWNVGDWRKNIHQLLHATLYELMDKSLRRPVSIFGFNPYENQRFAKGALDAAYNKKFFGWVIGVIDFPYTIPEWAESMGDIYMQMKVLRAGKNYARFGQFYFKQKYKKDETSHWKNFRNEEEYKRRGMRLLDEFGHDLCSKFKTIDELKYWL